MAYVWWCAAALVLGIVEVTTVTLYFLMLAIGALLAAGAAALGADLVAQIGVFALASLLLVVVVRPLVRRSLHRDSEVRTNAGALVGREAVVTERLGGASGRVSLGGDIWSARAVDSAEVPVGTRVRIVAIDGATAVVGPLGHAAREG